jgi:hypothetical protein
MKDEQYLGATEPDVNVDIMFQCKNGNTKARLSVSIEPDPTGKRTGEQAHFHTMILCNKI